MIGGNERARDRKSVDSDQQKTSEPANAGDQQMRQRLACCPPAGRPARAGADGGQQPDWRGDDDDRQQRTEMRGGAAPIARHADHAGDQPATRSGGGAEGVVRAAAILKRLQQSGGGRLQSGG